MTRCNFALPMTPKLVDGTSLWSAARRRLSAAHEHNEQLLVSTEHLGNRRAFVEPNAQLTTTGWGCRIDGMFYEITGFVYRPTYGWVFKAA